MFPVLKDILLYVHRRSAFEYERFERYGCSPEPGNLSDLVKCNSCQCDAKQGLFPGIRKEMVVLQKFEKGKRKWLLNGDLKKIPINFFQSLKLGGGGGGGVLGGYGQ